MTISGGFRNDFVVRHPGEGRDRMSLLRKGERVAGFVVEERFLPSQE